VKGNYGGLTEVTVGLTTLPPSSAKCLEIWEPQPPRTLRTCLGLYRDSFTTEVTTPAAASTEKTMRNHSQKSSFLPKI
jgi:hypothetical protein